MNIEGYWDSTKMPQRNTIDKNIKDSFLQKLNEVETQLKKSKSTYIGYFGFSYCRLAKFDNCEQGDFNGSWEYVTDTWTWPQGYKHYVEVHNVKPSDKFYKYIMNFDLAGSKSTIKFLLCFAFFAFVFWTFEQTKSKARSA